MQQVTEAYILGVREGRQFLKDNAWMDRTDMVQAMQNAADNMKRHSGVMRDAFKGERDFWKNQIKEQRA